MYIFFFIVIIFSTDIFRHIKTIRILLIVDLLIKVFYYISVFLTFQSHGILKYLFVIFFAFSIVIYLISFRIIKDNNTIQNFEKLSLDEIDNLITNKNIVNISFKSNIIFIILIGVFSDDNFNVLEILIVVGLLIIWGYREVKNYLFYNQNSEIKISKFEVIINLLIAIITVLIALVLPFVSNYYIPSSIIFFSLIPSALSQQKMFFRISKAIDVLNKSN